MLKALYIVVICFFIQLNLHSQEIKTTKIIQFAEYLTQKQLYREAIEFLESQKKNHQSTELLDSMNYLIGLNFCFLEDYSNSNKSYLSILNKENKLYNFSLFRVGYNYIQLHQYDTAYQYFKSIDTFKIDSALIELRNFSIASSVLLLRKFENNFVINAQNKPTSEYLIDANKNLNGFYKSLSKYRTKKTFFAGLLSAIIPGLGKLYIGKTGEAVGTFVPIATVGLLSLEAYNKAGIKSLPFIGFTTLFSVFYVSNIWGSINGVKLKNVKFNKLMNDKIIYNMQFPYNNILQ